MADDVDIGFALALQTLPYATSQVLVVGQVAGYRNGDRWFGEDDVLELLEDLRIPTPNVRRAIRNLLETGLLVARRDGRLSLTPVGAQRVNELFGHLDMEQLEAQLAYVPGAVLGEGRHTVIPATLAPVKWAEGIGSFLAKSPFDTNVFCMTRFPRDEDKLPDPIQSVINVARDVLGHHGLVMHLASDQIIDDDLWGNVAAHGWACRYGIGLFENRVEEGLNPNLIIEVGAMLMTGRRCALLKDRTVGQMPTDFIGHIYKAVDFEDVGVVSGEVHKWAAEDLGLGRCSSCP
jgi:hypothetical protein